MNKVIEQYFYEDVEITKDSDGDVTIYQGSDSVAFDKQGAAELIKVLREWVDENNI